MQYNKKSNLSSANIGIRSIGPIQILHFLTFIPIKRFVTICDGLWFLCRFDPSFFFAVMLRFSTLMVMVIGVFLALAFASFIRISSVLSQLLHPLQLFLLLSQLFLFFELFLFLLFFAQIFLFFLLHRCTHIQKLTILAESPCFLCFLFVYFFVQSFPILLDRVFGIFVNGNFNYTIIIYLF